jgi:hypothetical protein
MRKICSTEGNEKFARDRVYDLREFFIDKICHKNGLQIIPTRGVIKLQVTDDTKTRFYF